MGRRRRPADDLRRDRNSGVMGSARKGGCLGCRLRKDVDDLRRFYDFTGKVVLFVGAGGRQLLDPGTPLKKLVAIGKDLDALRELKKDVLAKTLQGFSGSYRRKLRRG